MPKLALLPDGLPILLRTNAMPAESLSYGREVAVEFRRTTVGRHQLALRSILLLAPQKSSEIGNAVTWVSDYYESWILLVVIESIAAHMPRAIGNTRLVRVKISRTHHIAES